jgi:hypothetical protein
LELLVIPVLLSVGALLVFLGVGDTPALETIPGAAYFRRSATRPALKTMRAYTPPPPAIEEQTLNESDALLTDVLSEMIQIRDELTELRDRLAQLEAQAEQPRPQAKRRFDH